MSKLLKNSVELTPEGYHYLLLPWRSGVTNLPNYKEMALRRLVSLKRRLP